MTVKSDFAYLNKLRAEAGKKPYKAMRTSAQIATELEVLRPQPVALAADAPKVKGAKRSALVDWMVSQNINPKTGRAKLRRANIERSTTRYELTDAIKEILLAK